jgi:HAD superfamily hydrolase (TIGR01509 family)
LTPPGSRVGGNDGPQHLSKLMPPGSGIGTFNGERSMPQPNSRVAGITFDLDDTLYDNRPVLERAEQTLHQWLVAHYPRLGSRFDLPALRELRLDIFRRNADLRHDLSTIRKLSLAAAARQVGYPPGLAEEAFAVFLEARNQVELFDDVLPALQGLRGRYTVGALTNGNADVERLGLGELFDFMVCAVDVGAAKPQPQMFLEAARRVGTMPDRLVHVGDDPVRDVAGGATAGLRTVWVNRLGADWPGGPPPDAEIGSLEELAGLLEAMG